MRTPTALCVFKSSGKTSLPVEYHPSNSYVGYTATIIVLSCSTKAASTTTWPSTMSYLISKDVWMSTLRPSCTPKRTPKMRSAAVSVTLVYPLVKWSVMLIITRGWTLTVWAL
jgi:hypothetical protein